MIDLVNAEILAINHIGSEQEEILRNVKVIVSTIRGQVVLDRDFGISPDVLDLPIPDAEAFFLVEAMEQVRINEPRASVKSVEFTSDMDGNFSPKVVIEIESS